MDKMKELFESTLLNEDSKVAIQEAFQHAVRAKTTEIEAEYVQKLEESVKEVQAQIPALIEEAVAEELAAIAEEVVHARTLEIQYAEKLNVFKESYAQKQEEQLELLIAESVAEEFEELKEEIELAKKHEFVMAMFESFKGTYEKLFGSSDVTVFDELNEAKEELEQYKRKETLERILETLTGDRRSIAETILEGVATDKLEAKFESIRGVLIAENATDTDKPAGTVVEEGRVVLENEEPAQVQKSAADDVTLQRLQKSLQIARRTK